MSTLQIALLILWLIPTTGVVLISARIRLTRPTVNQEQLLVPAPALQDRD